MSQSYVGIPTVLPIFYKLLKALQSLPRAPRLEKKLKIRVGFLFMSVVVFTQQGTAGKCLGTTVLIYFIKFFKIFFQLLIYVKKNIVLQVNRLNA